MKGGIFLYPATLENPKRPKSKLRLLYEANPIAMLIEQAGGTATNGDERIMEVVPSELHQTTPLVAGSRAEVEFYMQLRKSED